MTATSVATTYAVFVVATVAVLAVWLGLMAIVDRAHRVVRDRDWGQRGGVVADILIFIGAVVVVAAVAGVACGQCVGSAGAEGWAPGTSYHEGRRGDGGDNGNGNDQRRCHHATGDCRGSFSPGPFDRSPVDAFNGNTVCLPGSTCYANSPSTTTTTTSEERVR